MRQHRDIFVFHRVIDIRRPTELPKCATLATTCTYHCACSPNSRKYLIILTSDYSNLAKWPHRRRTCTVQWRGGATVQSHLIHVSVGPSESKSQTACRSVQPFFAKLTAESRLYSGPRVLFSALKLALLVRGSGPASITWFLLEPKSSIQTTSRSVQPFLQSSLV